MTPLTTPDDQVNYVPLHAYAEQGRALEALQDTCREYQADAHAALQLLTEARKLLREGLVDMAPLRRGAWNKKARGFLDGAGDIE